MAANRSAYGKHVSDRGVSIVIVALGMVFILGMAGLAIDLASLYVARSQAQRAADAAALAGAKAFLQAGCVSATTGGLSGTCETIATNQAVAVGNSNLIGGVSPAINSTTDVSFPSETTSDPQIQVVAGRGTYNGTNHNNPLPTFFMKIFGINTASVSATAVAEAYASSGTSANVGSICLKPWLLPNCDPNNATAPLNPNCSPAASEFVTDTGIESSAVGELITIKPGDPSSAIGPGKFYPVYLPPGSVASANSCPSCATGQTSSGSQSGNQYRQNIECCNVNPVVCGQQYILAISGNMVGPTQQGVECLIHQGNGNQGGQDTFDPSTWTILSGGFYKPVGTVMGSSDSIATIPIYDGSPICPGGSNGSGTCTNQAQVTIIGFMQVFIKEVKHAQQGTVEAYIMSIVKCNAGSGGSGGGGGGTGGGGAGGGIVGPPGSPIPIRLIRR